MLAIIKPLRRRFYAGHYRSGAQFRFHIHFAFATRGLPGRRVSGWPGSFAQRRHHSLPQFASSPPPRVYGPILIQGFISAAAQFRAIIASSNNSGHPGTGRHRAAGGRRALGWGTGPGRRAGRLGGRPGNRAAPAWGRAGRRALPIIHRHHRPGAARHCQVGHQYSTRLPLVSQIYSLIITTSILRLSHTAA